MTVIDVAEQDFQREVVARSHEVPVVVDFWAAWCGPCRMLTPVLEKAAAAREGKVVLAKVDTDANPGISRAFGIQGIPAVKAFVGGEVVDEFVGAQGPPAVERFFDGLVPSEADVLAGSDDEADLRRALELDPGRPDASLKLARILLGRGELEEAGALASGVHGSFQADGIAARVRLQSAEGDPLELAPAFAALDAADHATAIDGLLAALPGAGDAKDDVRQVVVGVLDELGVEHPLARDARRRLMTALY